MISPSDCGTTFTCETGTETSTSVIVDYIETTYGVTELYKMDQGDEPNDTGLFATSYDTTFANTTTDPEDATITYISGASISCLECYLLVKDGNQDPAWYLFDISIWDGTETIYLTDFWPDNGAISHVSIYGDTSVPEPGVLALLGIGLAGFGFRRIKKLS